MLIAEADKSSDCYLFVYTLREMLGFTSKDFPELEQLTNWLFSKADNRYDGESVYYVISECIGKIAMLSSAQLKKFLGAVREMSDNRRYIVANSLRFAFEDR